MAYKALYRTYRPSTFEEVAGQTHVVKTIKNALATGKLAHAYLFTGPRGTGKTSMAKLLAKSLNCEEGVGCQCNKCKNCIAINEGNHPDVLEIDAASNSGVDEIRNLIDKVKYGTILGKYKVYIIDEVHMMTSSAFNALLKTLEEPPAHVIFILATTEPHKILPTILSRCQRYDFTRLSDNDIKERIRIVLSKSGVEFNDEAVNLIVSLADGGMRDALSILDQVLAYSNNRLNYEDILDMFSLESKEEKIKLLTCILNGHLVDVLSRLSNYISKGTDLKRLISDLLIILKDVLIYKNTRTNQFFEILNEQDIINNFDHLDKKTIMELINILLDTLKEIRTVSSINSLVELTLVKMTSSIQQEVPAISEVEDIKIIQPKVVQTPVQSEVKVEESPFNIEKVEKEKVIVNEEKKENEIFQSDSFDIEIETKILEIANTRVEDSFNINDEIMVPIMVLSKKEFKNNFTDQWKKLFTLVAHPLLGKYASLLLDGHALVASNKILILEYQLPKNVDIINQINIQQFLQTIIQQVFKTKVFVYAVSRNESLRLQKIYTDLRQVGRLPKPNDVTIDFIGD